MANLAARIGVTIEIAWDCRPFAKWARNSAYVCLPAPIVGKASNAGTGLGVIVSSSYDRFVHTVDVKTDSGYKCLQSSAKRKQHNVYVINFLVFLKPNQIRIPIGRNPID